MSAQDQLVLSGIVLAITQVLKTAGLPSKWAGFVSIVLGIIVSALWATDMSHWRTLIFDGVGTGLIASGAYSQAKAELNPADPPHDAAS